MKTKLLSLAFAGMLALAMIDEAVDSAPATVAEEADTTEAKA